MIFLRSLLNVLSFIVPFAASTQDLTGIWKGYFEQETTGYGKDRYNFEIHIKQRPDNTLHCTTYSTKEGVFYGQADAKGIYSPGTKTVVISENRLEEVKVDKTAVACLMLCNLTYRIEKDKHILRGTYSSKDITHTNDCGSGTVYLVKTDHKPKKPVRRKL